MCIYIVKFTRHSLIRLHVQYMYVLHIYDYHYEHLAGLTNSVSTPKYTGNHMYMYNVLHHTSCRFRIVYKLIHISVVVVSQ